MFFWQFIVNLKSKSSKLLSYIIVGTCTAILTMLLGWNPQPSIANNPSKDLTDLVPTQSLPNSPSTHFQNGKQLYHAGQYAKAIASWQQALNIYMKQGDRLNRAIVLNNLALASQQLGQWHDADRTIAMSLEILKSEPQQEKLLAQALNIQGSIQLIQGKAQEALTIWQMATASYEQVGDKDGAMRSKINQSQAMRALGLYPKAKSLLQQVQIELREQPDSSLKASSLLNLGDTLQRSGELEDAKVVLQESLAIAKQINNTAIIANTLLSLGNTTYRLQQPAEAIGYYQQAINTATAPILKLQAQLNLLRLQIDTQQSESTQLLLTAIQTQLPNLPPSRDSVYAKVNFVQSLTKLNLPSSNRQAAAQILAIAAQQAKDMGDPRSESYALGYLG